MVHSTLLYERIVSIYELLIHKLVCVASQAVYLPYSESSGKQGM